MIARSVLSPRTGVRRRLTPVAAVSLLGLGFVALLAALLALPGGKVVGDTTTNIQVTSAVEVRRDQPVLQPFVASEDRLASIYVTFGTNFGAAQCDVRVTLVERAEGPGVGEEVASRDWSCADLADSGRFEVLEFEPILDSEGTLYDVLIQMVDEGAGPDLVVWAGTPRGDALPVVVAGVADPTLSAAVRGEYDPQSHRWDHMGQTLTRLAAYGPSWGTAAGFVSLVLATGALLASAPLARRSTTVLLLGVAALAILRGLTWSAAVPALEAMDEPAHFAYVQFLAEERVFPGHVDNHGIYSERLYGTIGALNVEATFPGDRPDYSPGVDERIRDQLEELSPKGGGGGPGSMYAPFYYLPAVPLYEAGGDDILDQIPLVRLWSVLLGVGAALLLALLGRQLFPSSSAAQVAFVVAGVMQPMAAHQFAVVNNDAWVIVSGFAALAIALALARRGRSPGLSLLAGAVIGAALLGKPFGVAVAVPLAVGWLIGKVRARQRSLRVLVLEPILVAIGFALTYGLWMATAARLHLNTSELPEHRATEPTSLIAFLRVQFGGGLGAARAIWGHQLWANFGWVRIPLPEPVPQFFFVVTVGIMIALLVWAVLALRDAVRRRRAGGRPADDSALAVDERAGSDLRHVALPLDVRLSVVAAMVASTVLTLYAAGWLYYQATGMNDLLQGRYALLAVPAFIAAPALLIERFTDGRVRPLVVNVVIAVGMVVAYLLGLLVVLEAFYG